jgi:xanthomonalisin
MQVLANPGFDAGSMAWTETTLSSSTIITPDSALMSLKAQSPSNLAWLGGYAGAMDDLSQVVAIPAGATAITLSFYYAIATQEGSPAIADTMDVYVYDPSTAKYTAVAAFNDNMSTPNWTRFVATLPLSLAGKTVQVGFEATTDGTKNTNFFVDTVALDVVACTPAP